MSDNFDGPIPGENYTSDTKNYPWHRPPEFTDLDKAIDYIGKKLTSEEASVGLLTMIETGIPISDLAQTFCMSGIGAGKWTLDFALLLAGPVAHIMQIMAKSYGMEYELGLEDDTVPPPGGAFFKVMREINRAKARAAGREASDQIDDIEADTNKIAKEGTLVGKELPKFRGLANARPEENQEAMLGRAELGMESA